MDPGETRLIKPITEVQTLHVSAHMIRLQESRYQGYQRLQNKTYCWKDVSWGGGGAVRRILWGRTPGWQGGLAGKRACYQTWWPKFNPQNPQTRKRESTPNSCHCTSTHILQWARVLPTHTHTHWLLDIGIVHTWRDGMCHKVPGWHVYLGFA